MLPGSLAAQGLDRWFSPTSVLARQVLARIAIELLGSAVDPAERRELLRRALRERRVVAIRVARPDVIGLQIVEDTVKQGPQEKVEPESITYPRWSTPRVPVGSDLFALVTYTEIKSPVSATIVVSEVDDRGSGREEVARIRTTIPTGTGDHKVKWSRRPDDARADLAEDKARGDAGPLEYRFKVESDRLKCTEESGPLWLTNTVQVDVVHEETRNAHESPRIVVLCDAVGQERRKWSRDGRAKFEDVLVGPMNVRIARPTFTDLTWGVPRAPVGAEVLATFEYSDAMKGMKALLLVYEVNQDGTSDEVHRETLTLDAERGAANVPFTRSEEEAESDIAEDLAQGDDGPVEYRFTIAAEGEETEFSSSLWLTHSVSLTVEDTAEEGAYPPGVEVVLLAADGTEHRAPFSGDEVTFDDVVCGPMIVRLDSSRAIRGAS